jgi:hypothetical protein
MSLEERITHGTPSKGSAAEIRTTTASTWNQRTNEWLVLWRV